MTTARHEWNGRQAVSVVLLVAVLSGCSLGGADPAMSRATPVTVAGADPATPAATPAPATAATEPQLAIGAGPVNDLDELTVQGTGFPPGAEVVLAQCTDGAAVGTAMIEACDLPDSVIADAGPDGTFAAQFTIRSVIAFGTRREVVCPDSTCAMGAADATDTVLTLTPLTWSADAAVPPAPQLTIAELTLDPDKNTGTAVLTGSGYTPGSRVALAQCPATPAPTGWTPETASTTKAPSPSPTSAGTCKPRWRSTHASNARQTS